MRLFSKFTRSLFCLGALSSGAIGQGTPGAASGPIGHNDSRVHPGFTMTNLVPAGAPNNWPRVGGMDFLPNGDLVVSTWDGFGNASGTTRPGRVFVFKKTTTGDSTQVTYAQLGANDMNEPLGLKVVGGEIYISEKDSIVHLVDADKNQVLDRKQKVGGTAWTRYISDNGGKDLSFAHGLVRLPEPDGRFIVALATRWNESGGAYNNGPSASTAEKGCVLGIRAGAASMDTIACGLRSPDGVVLGPEDGIFITDNHGHFVPASKLVHVKPGRFFNVRKTQASPFENVPVTRPVLWLPHGNALANVSVSATQPVYLRSGTFKGQMLAGDNNMGTLQRYFLERVAGEYQGAVFRFSGGLRAAAHRIVEGPDSAIYIGGIGATGSEWGGWAWNSRQAGLQRMKETGQPFFDVLAVRSMGSNTFEIEFTEPIVSADASNFPQVQQWAYTPALAYGTGKQATETLTLESVVVSSDKKKITLTIPGLKKSNVVHLRWSNLAAVSGRPLMTDRVWYTLNEFGPGEVVGVRPDVSRNPVRTSARALGDGRIEFMIYSSKPVTVGIYDMSGSLLESIPAASGSGVTRSRFKPGIYLMRAGSGAHQTARKVHLF